MIPTFGGGLTNSGSMPINAAGGASGPSAADAKNSIGGIRTGDVNFGGSATQTVVKSLPLVLLAIGFAWVAFKK